MKENWTYKKVKEVCKKASSNIVLNKIEDNTGDFPLYGASGFVKGVDFYHRDEPYIGIVKDGSGVGRVDVYPAKSSLVGTMQYILPQKECSLKYLCYALQGLNLSQFVNGAAIPHIYFRDYGECTIPVPPIETQSCIVSELDLLQSIIDKQKAQVKELDNLAQAVFYDMFGDPVENEKGWEVKKLGEVCITITKGTTPTTVGFSFVSEGVNFVKVESFDKGKIDASKLTHITKDCNDALSRSQLEDLDLLICIAGATIGKMAIVDSSILPANTNQACAIIRLKNKSSLVYVQSFLAHKFRLDVEQMGKGVAQPNLSLGQLRELQIPLPPLFLQQSFASKIESIEKQKAAITQSITETQRLFDYTMDKYFG